MRFYKPVVDSHKMSALFMEWGARWDWIVDPDTGFWIPKGSESGRKGQHRGVDFDCPRGTIVSAMADGMIVKARHESALDPKEGAGLHLIQIVELLGFDAWWIKYSHLKDIKVQIGQRIKRGQPIGESGESGGVDHPLLHIDLMDPKHQYHPIQWN